MLLLEALDSLLCEGCSLLKAIAVCSRLPAWSSALSMLMSCRRGWLNRMRRAWQLGSCPCKRLRFAARYTSVCGGRSSGQRRNCQLTI